MKKIIAILLALAAILSLAACGGNTPAEDETTTNAPAVQLEGTLEEISNKILENATTIEMMLAPPTPVDFADVEAAKYYIGVDPTDKVDSAVFTEPMIGSIPFSMVLIDAKDGVDIESLKNEVLESINLRKWVCVSAEKAIVSNCGDKILMIMSTEVIADDVYAAFNTVASGAASPALTRAGEVAEEPPVDGGDAAIDEPAAMPGEGIILG